jgi:acyl dehydratase
MDESARHPRGGIYFEDFAVGTTIRHRLTRTVTQMDNMLFSNMTLNPQPLFEGDTVSVTTEVADKRESKSRPDAGIVDFLHRAYNQDGTLVAECRRQAFMRKRPA